jgi:CheY-like chemotaxis protein
MTDHHQHRILLIEDDYDVAEMLLMYFQAQGYEVHHADSGGGGVELARRLLPHVILLDVMLPDMDGYDTCIELRNKSLTRYIPILFLTQRDERTAKVKGLELGADDYVTKPFDVDELRLRVQGSIHRATRENLHESRTGLPTGTLVESELQRRDGENFYQLYFRISNYYKYTDLYGFMAGYDVLFHAGKIIQDTMVNLGTADDFAGIIDDDFILLTYAKDVRKIEKNINQQFDDSVKAFYNFGDVSQGGILVNSDTSDEQLVPFMQLQRIQPETS